MRGKNYITRSLILCTFHQTLLGSGIKKYKMGTGTLCGMHIMLFSKSRKRDFDGRKITKLWILML